MEINLIVFALAQSKQCGSEKPHAALLEDIKKHFDIHWVSCKELGKLNRSLFSVVLVASGGTGKVFEQCYEQLPHPVVLLADGDCNSLGAALEMAAWARQRGVQVEILHGGNREVLPRLADMCHCFAVLQGMQQRRVGVIGGTVPWLIASNVDYLLAKRRWGLEYIDIPMERLVRYSGEVAEEDMRPELSYLAMKAEDCCNASPQELLKALRVYKAVKRICEEDRLDAVTLNCPALSEQLQATGCLALSLLNNEGIPAVCDGDLQAAFTLLAAKMLTGRSGLMVTPVSIDCRYNEVQLSYCFANIRRMERFVLQNSMTWPDKISVQGMLPLGEVTMLRCGGECLDEYWAASGKLLENIGFGQAAHSQVKVRLNTPVDSLFKHPLGSHQILLPGDCTEMLDRFLQMNSCRKIG